MVGSAQPEWSPCTLLLSFFQDIEKGDEITKQHVSSILGNHKRRKRIMSDFYLDCECQVGLYKYLGHMVIFSQYGNGSIKIRFLLSESYHYL